MAIRAILLDFDGTLVEEDILSVLAEIVNEREQSDRINQEFHKGIKLGLQGLIERINLLQGVSLEQIEKKLNENDYLMKGTVKFLQFLHENNVVTILASGNIMPVLNYYQRLLNLDYIVGSCPKIKDNIITGISEEDFPHDDYKLSESVKILKRLSIKPEETIAIGDSPGDKSRFLFAGKSIAVNPKGGIEKYADYVIGSDLKEAISIMELLNQ